jgi:hypothetical protein
MGLEHATAAAVVAAAGIDYFYFIGQSFILLRSVIIIILMMIKPTYGISSPHSNRLRQIFLVAIRAITDGGVRLAYDTPVPRTRRFSPLYSVDVDGGWGGCGWGQVLTFNIILLLLHARPG